MDTLCVDGRTQTLSLSDYADIIALDETKQSEVGGFKVACRQTRHHIPTFAFKIFAEGRSIGFSADTAYDSDLIEWLSGCDLIVHETNEGIHTPYEKLAALSESLKRKMRLIHYPDDFDLRASAVEPLVQGQSVEVL